MTDQIECTSYRCSLSAESCAARYARAQEPGRAGRSSNRHLALCKPCEDGRDRWVQLGAKRTEAPKAIPRTEPARPKWREVYQPRIGQPKTGGGEL